jgi:hypothetical protein
MQDSAGRPYGFDAVTAWPRLYPVLSEHAGRSSMTAAARSTHPFASPRP